MSRCCSPTDAGLILILMIGVYKDINMKHQLIGTLICYEVSQIHTETDHHCYWSADRHSYICNKLISDSRKHVIIAALASSHWLLIYPSNYSVQHLCPFPFLRWCCFIKSSSVRCLSACGILCAKCFYCEAVFNHFLCVTLQTRLQLSANNEKS